jgi:hypothetical protein
MLAGSRSYTETVLLFWSTYRYSDGLAAGVIVIESRPQWLAGPAVHSRRPYLAGRFVKKKASIPVGTAALCALRQSRMLIRARTQPLVVPSGSLTSPAVSPAGDREASHCHSATPQLKDIGSYRDAAWLVKRQAVSALPALASPRPCAKWPARTPVPEADRFFEPNGLLNY